MFVEVWCCLLFNYILLLIVDVY